MTDRKTEMTEPLLRVEGLYKSFGKYNVIDGLSFTVDKGEFLTVLGSSGCGKTTLLRIICGLEEADGGRIILGGEDITDREPNLRPVNTVFQSYALFPHMNVFDNVAYALKIARVPKDEIKRRVAQALELVRMPGYEKRYASSLSGGQRQRIAIARAIVARPTVLLLDEPLGALDLNLRRTMQAELKSLQKQLGITFIYITHDQEEALNMSDRVAVMTGGKFLQIGTPADIYDRPMYTYVAKFVGDSNIIPCIFEELTDEGAIVSHDGVRMETRAGSAEHKQGETVNVVLRSEKIRISKSSGSSVSLSGIVESLNFSGGVMRITVSVGKERITATRYGLDTDICIGDMVFLESDRLAGIICEDHEAAK